MQGIKGVAHKYLLAALGGGRDIEDVIIKAETSRGKDKVISSGTKSLSSQYGLRTKLLPVTDSSGKQIVKDGKKVYKELQPKESPTTTDLKEIFEKFFNKPPKPDELEKMGSFLGLVELSKKYLSTENQEKIFSKFINTLFGPQAQSLYRSDKERDYNEKMTMAKSLNINLDKYTKEIENYFKRKS